MARYSYFSRDGSLTQAFEIAISRFLYQDAKKVALILALAKAAGPMGDGCWHQKTYPKGENQKLSLGLFARLFH